MYRGRKELLKWGADCGEALIEGTDGGEVDGVTKFLDPTFLPLLPTA